MGRSERMWMTAIVVLLGVIAIEGGAIAWQLKNLPRETASWTATSLSRDIQRVQICDATAAQTSPRSTIRHISGRTWA